MNDLNSNEWLLIKRQEYIDLIESAKKNNVDTELLQAIYKWLEQHNKLNEND
jgi:hypothetical protein